MLNLQQPEMLWLMVPVLAAGIYLIHKGAKKGLIISRMIVLALLVIALASPYNVVSKISSSETPDIVLISDETSSMELFEQETMTELYESLAANTPTNVVKLTGESTALGDAIVQYARGDNQIVLVSDGNSNKGQGLEEALEFARETGTTVYSVTPELKVNDVSLHINGEKTAVQNNEYVFEMIVQQAGNAPISYDIEVYVDDKLLPDPSKTYNQEVDQREILVTHTFDSLGAHKITASVTAAGEDIQPINNIFYKTVYVVPKPNVFLITNDKSSNFANNLDILYEVGVGNELSEITDINKQKAIVIDNLYLMNISENDIKSLEDYVINGHGLYVVGGDRAFDKGNYLNSSFEKLLPVTSKLSEFIGGKYVVLILDLSGSTLQGGEGNVTIDDVLSSSPTYPVIIQSAKNIIVSDDFKDATLGIVAMGDYVGDIPDNMYDLMAPPNVDYLNETLDNIRLKNNPLGETNLNLALTEAKQMIDSEVDESTTSRSIIVISDGADYKDTTFNSALPNAKNLVDSGYNLIYFDIESKAIGQIDSAGNIKAKKFMDDINSSEKYFQVTGIKGITINPEGEEVPEETSIEEPNVFKVFEYNQNHFITRNFNVSGNVTGYNEVTPKPGSERLLITQNGKSILTTWRYGLGRVATLATDNGKANGWSNSLFNATPKLTSSTMNWLIGDPQVEEGAVLEAEDTWFGTPAQLKLTMYDEGIPTITLDDTRSIDLSLTGKDTYEAMVDVGQVGVHHISGYPIAVNYALEYRDVGVNPELEMMIKANGGKTYTKSEAQALLLTDAKDNSQKLIKESVSQKIYFILAALIIFLLEVIIRRLREIKEMKEQEKRIREVSEA